MANLQIDHFKILCGNHSNFVHMHRVLHDLCHTDYRLDLLSSTRIRKHYKGRCVWSAYYSIVNGTIAGKKAFEVGVRNLILRKPFDAELVSSGRYGGPNYGIVIQWGNVNCDCIPDLHNEMTLFIWERSQQNFIQYDVAFNTVETSKDGIISVLDEANSATNSMLIIVNGNSELHKKIIENYVLNSAHISFILKLKKMIVVINEENPYELFSSQTRFKKNKKILCDHFNSANQHSALHDVTFTQFCIYNHEMETNQNIPWPNVKKIKLIDTTTVTFVERETYLPNHSVSVTVAETTH